MDTIGMTDKPKSNDELAVLAVIDREVHAVSSGDAGTYFHLLDDQAAFLPPQQLPKSGADLRRWLREFVEQCKVTWQKFEHGDVKISGDLAYHVYTFAWSVHPRAGGNTASSEGKGIHVLRRSTNGDWKILLEIWNSNPHS